VEQPAEGNGGTAGYRSEKKKETEGKGARGPVVAQGEGEKEESGGKNTFNLKGKTSAKVLQRRAASVYPCNSQKKRNKTLKRGGGPHERKRGRKGSREKI